MDTKKRKRKESRLDSFLEMPKEIVTDLPKFTILGFEEMLIENYKGILEYEEFYIKLSTYIGMVNINGFHLQLNQMKDETILVTGQIDSVTLEKDVDDQEVQFVFKNNI